MKLIMHIGMGKTGTTSIQHALRTNTEELENQRAYYLGMWLDFIDPKFHRLSGEKLFFALNASDQEEAAKRMVKKINELSHQTGAETFIFSNETFFSQAKEASPFFKTLQSKIDTSILAYIRDPRTWLPSAYSQWELRHKTHSGPLKPFSIQARNLIKKYDGYTVWKDSFPDILAIRLHDETIDVIGDFVDFCGINFRKRDTRHLTRNEDAEVLLRAAFNNRTNDPVLPIRFNTEIVNTNKKVQSLDDLAKLCFEFEDIQEIVNTRHDLFERIRRDLGENFDFLSRKPIVKKSFDMQATRQRLIDLLIEALFTQADRIQKIEQQLKELQQRPE
jgi:hypothetical protein